MRKQWRKRHGVINAETNWQIGRIRLLNVPSALEKVASTEHILMKPILIR
jgi:hypothetical protein